MAIADNEGKLEKGEVGVIRYDFGKTQGMLLPFEKFPTANGEPVFVFCTKYTNKEKAPSFNGGGCEARYEYKPNLYISYWAGSPERNFYIENASDPNHLTTIDQRQRDLVDQFLKENPEFYPLVLEEKNQ